MDRFLQSSTLSAAKSEYTDVKWIMVCADPTLCRRRHRCQLTRLCHPPPAGPGTKFLGAAELACPEDLIIVLDDDADYAPNVADQLISHSISHKSSAWGLIGLDFDQHIAKGPEALMKGHGLEHDFLFGVGGIILKAGWVQQFKMEYLELVQMVPEGFLHDDLMLSNLLAKQGVARRLLKTQTCSCKFSIRHHEYGKDQETALHAVSAGGTVAKTFRVLRALAAVDKYYFRCSIPQECAFAA